MPNGSEKPGEALGDRVRDEFDKNRRERELSVARLEIRAEQRSAPDVEENTGVIHREALALQSRREVERRQGSDPPSGHAKEGIALVRSVRSWPQAVVAVAFLVVVALALWLKLHP